MKSYHIRCPKCNNNHSFYRYGKDSNGYQKYLCRNCCHQFAPERPRSEGQIVGGNIRLALCAEKFPFCITIMSINKQFKAWYKTKQVFSSFESANNLIPLFVFLFNFVRLHSALNGLTLAQVAGLNLSKQRKWEFSLVA